MGERSELGLRRRRVASMAAGPRGSQAKVLQYETFVSDVLQRDLRPDPSRIFVALGYGFFLELTLMEALRFIDRKSRLLTSLSDSLTRDSARIKAHIRLVLEGLRELQGLQELPDHSGH